MLYDKIANTTATIGVVGLGYVGLPLAVEKAKAGFNVIGFDIQGQKVWQINCGENYIGDVIPEDLKTLVTSGKLRATTRMEQLEYCDIITICVPTPLDKYKQPDLTYVRNVAQHIAKHLTKETLVILESTTYPGTTEDVILPILLGNSKSLSSEEFYLAFSPERVDPGNLLYKTKNTPKVVGGINEKSADLAKLLYEKVLQAPVTVVSSTKAAEMTKILENSYRLVNISLINELAILANKMDIDIWEVINAAATKPFGFTPFYPGAGAGGHCIPIDPFYLSYISKKYDTSTTLINLAGEINEQMPSYIVQRTMEILNEHEKHLKNANILLVGAAYKGDIDDTRESPALKIAELLQLKHANVDIYDPYIKNFAVKKDYEIYDLVIITTAHTHNIDYQELYQYSRLIFDLKNILQGEKVVKL